MATLAQCLSRGDERATLACSSLSHDIDLRTATLDGKGKLEKTDLALGTAAKHVKNGLRPPAIAWDDVTDVAFMSLSDVCPPEVRAVTANTLILVSEGVTQCCRCRAASRVR